MLRKELHLSLTVSTFWTDSWTDVFQSVLKYIRNQTKRFRTFVSNRVAVIQDLSYPSQWRYINSKENPADNASRGLHVESFFRSRWRRGPEFLSREKRTWPQVTQGQGEIPASDPEVKKEVTVNDVEKGITVNSVKIENQHPICILIKYHSSCIWLKKSVAWILKVKRILELLSQLRKDQTRVFRIKEKTKRQAWSTKSVNKDSSSAMNSLTWKMANPSVQETPFTNWIQFLIMASWE